MKRCYLMTLFLLFTVVSVVQASYINIVPEDQTAYEAWLPTYGNSLKFLVSVTGASSSGSITFSLRNVTSWPGRYMKQRYGNHKRSTFPFSGKKGFCKCSECPK